MIRAPWLQQHTSGFRATPDWRAWMTSRPWLPAVDCANRLTRLVRLRATAIGRSAQERADLNTQLAKDLREVADVLRDLATDLERPEVQQ